MAISDAEYAKWLQLPDKHRVVLVVAENFTSTEYFGSSSFVSRTTDTPANIAFEDSIIKVPVISSNISGRASVGELELVNDGSLDSWPGLSWIGYPIQVYFGDKDWEFDDFRLVINGINAGVKARRHDRISIQFADRSKEFNVALQDTFHTTGDPFPIALGNVFNATPLLIDGPTHVYRVHEGTCTIPDVRDNGASVAYTDNGNGTFTLGAQPFGSVTCDVVQADNTASDQVAYIAAKLGFTDLDASVAAFPNTDQVGKYFNRTVTGVNALNEVLRGLGGYWYFTALGFLAVRRFETGATSVLDIIPDLIIENQINITRTEQPNTRITVKYKLNNTEQDAGSLAGSLNDDDRNTYSQEWLTEIVDNVLPEFPLASEQDDTLTTLQLQADAATEATRRAALRGVKRIVYGFTAYTAPFSLKIGDTITLFNQRFDLAAGVDGIIVSIKAEPTANKVSLEVWV